MNYISTSALGVKLEITSSNLFDILSNLGYITRKDDKWDLTQTGINAGGQLKESSKYGTYIVWPENLNIEPFKTKSESKLLNATTLGKHFDVSPQRFNLLINELGWMEKTIAGWQITKLGKYIGGKQLEIDSTGNTYILWPESVFENSDLLGQFPEKVSSFNTENIKQNQTSKSNNSDKNHLIIDSVDDFRKKFPAEYRTKDGHYVRSKAEMAIDDSLYLWGIAHAYEKKLPNTLEDVYCDFFIPSILGKPAVYIEYWGLENDPKYLERKKKKVEIYKSLDFKLIELDDSHLKNLEDVLQKQLLKHEIKVNG